MKKDILKQIFWDVNEANLARLSDRQIISRVFYCGGLEAIKNIFAVYKVQEIKDTFNELKEKAISEKRYNYFKMLLG